MAAIWRRCADAGSRRRRHASRSFLAIVAGAAAVSCAPVAAAREPLVDAPPVWYDDDARDIPKPERRDPSLAWEGIQSSMVRAWGRGIDPIRLVRRVGTAFGRDHVPRAADINTLGEVPNSTWFTNRIGIRSLSPTEAARGPGQGIGPDPRPPWTVVKAKTEGLTPGFTIEDSRGDRYLLKFDLPEFRNASTAAGVITNRILWAAGYNVPDDNIITFSRDRLVLDPEVKTPNRFGELRPMTQDDLDSILDRVEPDRDATIRAISSRFLPGVPVGPFDNQGRREDDPNDRIEHEDRRELRGLREFASWLNHFDLKQQNSLDMWVEQDGRRFVRHYLIDFASTLGTGATGPVPIYGHEYQVDGAAIFSRLFTLGLREDPWRRLRRPEGLSEVGYLENEVYHPDGFKPQHHNSAFANTTDRDSYWAAKIISAFSDEHLRAIVDTGRYDDPDAAEYVTRLLAARRDRIARHWFDRVPPLDFFRPEGGGVRYSDLGAERGVYPGTPVYRFRCAAIDADRSADHWSAWQESTRTYIPLDAGAAAEALEASRERYPFLALQCRVSRGEGWSDPVTAYLARAVGRIVAVDR